MEHYELMVTCNFRDVFKTCSRPEDFLSSREEPVGKIGHVRAYFDGRQWWGDYFPCRDSLKTEPFVEESQKLYKQIVSEFPDLAALRLFCQKHPDSYWGDEEYNFYINGEVANYWVRFILREKDYNCYLNAYVRCREENK